VVHGAGLSGSFCEGHHFALIAQQGAWELQSLIKPVNRGLSIDAIAV